jgi:hypothetical protein
MNKPYEITMFACNDANYMLIVCMNVKERRMIWMLDAGYWILDT